MNQQVVPFENAPASRPEFRAFARPRTDRVAFALTFATLIALFGFSGLTLETLGYEYAGSGGSNLFKLHPSTYLAVLTFAYLALRRGNPVAFVDQAFFRQPRITLFLGCVVLLEAFAVAKSFPLTPVPDTFFVPLLLFAIIKTLTPATKRTLAAFIHVFFALNTIIGVVEYVVGSRLVEALGETSGVLILLDDWRPTSLLGLPLTNSFLTGAYLFCLLLGKSPRNVLLRVSLTGLQVLGLIVFGGRATLVISTILLLYFLMLAVFHFLRGATVHRLAPPIIIVGAGIAIAGLVYMSGDGFFDQVMERFVWDESTATRTAALHMLELLDLPDFIFGISSQAKENLQFTFDSQFGVEVFWISFLMDYGAIMLVVFCVCFLAFGAQIISQCSRGAGLIFFYFLVNTNTSLGISAKGTLVSMFVAMLLLLLPRGPDKGYYYRPAPPPEQPVDLTPPRELRSA